MQSAKGFAVVIVYKDSTITLCVSMGNAGDAANLLI